MTKHSVSSKGILQHEFHLREKEEVTQWPDLEMTQGDDLE